MTTQDLVSFGGDLALLSMAVAVLLFVLVRIMGLHHANTDFGRRLAMAMNFVLALLFLWGAGWAVYFYTR